MAELDPRVAEHSPALYSAAYYSNLNPAQINQINQISNTVGLNKELMNMPKEDAQTRYSKLDSTVQEQLKAMYGSNTQYMPQPKTWQMPTNVGAIANDALQVGKRIGSGLLSPFRAAFKIAGEYNRAINTPYLVWRQVQQGGNVFDANVWRDAWDGTNVFDNQSLGALHDKYGDTDTFVAMHALQGMKPGQIIDAYGKVNSDIINSISKMVNDPKAFETMINDFKGAQVSFGRDATRMLFHAQPTDSQLYSSSKWNKTSGAIDAIAQIVIDPLTWITGGTSKLVSRGDRLAELISKDPEVNVAKVFARPDIQNTWTQAGKMIEELHNARLAGNKAAAVTARDNIRRQMPDLNNDDMLNILVKEKVFNPKAAEKFFSSGENMLKLMGGSVDGTTFWRSGVPIAKRTNSITSGLNKVIGDYFNGSLEKADLDKVGDRFVDELRKVGIDNDPIYAAKNPFLQEKTAELKDFKRRLGRMAARFPGSEEIHVTDNMVNKSLPVVRNLARTIYPRAYSEYFAEAFRTANQEDRVILLKGLYTQIMYNMGLHATDGGRQLMQRILQDKFADTTGFSVSRNLDVPPQFKDEMVSRGLLEEQPPSNVGGMLKTSYDGPLHPYQSKPTIGNLPWHGTKDNPASLADYAFSFGKTRDKRDFIAAAGGITRKNFVTKAVDNWSTATLFPRLGIRSAIDEAFIYSMFAPGKTLMRFAEGRKLNKAIIAFMGDDSVMPPIKRAVLNALGRNPAKYIPEIAEKEGEKGRFLKVNGEDLYRLQKQEDIARHAATILEGGVFDNPRHLQDMYQAMVHHPEIANAMVNSIIGKSGLGNNLAGGDLASMIISNSNLTKMYKELGFTKSGTFKEYTAEQLAKINESALVAAHFDNFFFRFTKNGRDYGKGNLNFGTIFMRHNGLRTGEDFAKARAEILEGIGLNPVTLAVENRKVLEKYLSESQQFARDKARGWSEVDTAVKRVEMQLLDMYKTFHGSAISYNDRLYNKIHEIAGSIQAEKEGTSYSKALREALNSVDYKLFEEQTRGFRPEGMINTDIHFSPDGSNEGMMQAMSNWAADIRQHSMEWMDAQNNSLFRQPALWSTYANFRDRYRNMEKLFVKQQTKALMDEGYNQEKASQRATEIAEKKFTETAMDHAANYLLRSVDNPKIRSNISWTLRTTGRYYRATEDFYRRVFRLKDVTPQVLYRMRLAHLGFQSNGFIHPDQNGDPYLIMPADNIIFHAVNGSIAAITGNPDAVKQPMFNDFAVKIAMGNPSFQQDAGQPSLSGPFIAVPVVALKRILGTFGGDIGKQAASGIDKLILGNVNQNLTISRAIIPSSFQRVWGMLPQGDKDQQTVSAAMQAIAYNAANGLFLSPDKLAQLDQADSAKATSDYLNQIRVTTHNILFLRNFLGLLAPISPTLQESRGIPDYLKNSGINGMRPEFADILQSVMRNSKGDIQDPYGAALMAFTGKYPGKLVYTVARDTKAVNVLINKTSALKSWMLSNDSILNKYKSGAGLIFAPNIGQYDTNVYQWMTAAGLLQQRDLQDYFNEVSIAEDRQKYYDLRTQAEEELKNPVYNSSDRQYIIDNMKYLQDLLKKNNPYLDIALNSKTFGIGKQEQMFNDLQGILKDDKFPISDAQRKKMSVAVALVRNAIDAINNDSFADVINGGQAKQEMKQRVLAALRELGGAEGTTAPQDPYINEAMRSIFLPLLNFYVRDTKKVTN